MVSEMNTRKEWGEAEVEPKRFKESHQRQQEEEEKEAAEEEERREGAHTNATKQTCSECLTWQLKVLMLSQNVI